VLGSASADGEPSVLVIGARHARQHLEYLEHVLEATAWPATLEPSATLMTTVAAIARITQTPDRAQRISLKGMSSHWSGRPSKIIRGERSSSARRCVTDKHVGGDG